MTHVIVMKVQNYLNELISGSGETLEASLLEAFLESASKNLQRQLSPEEKQSFRLRMSNLGRPGCVLQAEALGLKRDQAPYSTRFRNLFGDLVEAAAVAIMRNASVNVVAEQLPVSLEIAGRKIDGTADIVINEGGMKVYDIKSASSWAYANKYLNKNLQSLLEDGDNFGYLTQIYLYSVASGFPVGGLIIINKETGEWTVVEPPVYEDELRDYALTKATANVRRIIEKEPFRKDFAPIAELFRGKPTGNTVLSVACSFCSWRNHCWPDVKYQANPVSKGKSPTFKYYAHVDKKYGKEEYTGNIGTDGNESTTSDVPA